VLEIIVAGEHRQAMTDAQLGQEGIDGSDLHAAASAAISHLGGPNVIVTIGHQQRYGGKPIQDPIAGSGAREALKELLKDEAGRNDRLAGLDRLNQPEYLACRRRRVTPERERPHASVHEKAQSRVRSAL
jgi:hypothetical protein